LGIQKSGSNTLKNIHTTKEKIRKTEQLELPEYNDWNEYAGKMYTNEIVNKIDNMAKRNSLDEDQVLSMDHLGNISKLLSGSKSFYRSKHPRDFVLFNSNVYKEYPEGEYKKIWWGDINITESNDNLKSLAGELGVPIYVLYEMDGRFGNEEYPNIDQYAIKVYSDDSYEIRESLEEFYDILSLELKEEHVRYTYR